MHTLLRVLEISPEDYDVTVVTTLDLDLCGDELDIVVDEVLANDTIIFGEGGDTWNCGEVLAHPDLCVRMDFGPEDADEDLFLTTVFEAVILG